MIDATRRLILLAVLAALVGAGPAGAQALQKRLNTRLGAPPLENNLWGVVLMNTDGKQLYGRNAERMFIPASNTKLVVSAVAAALLPPDWTVTTSVYADGPVQDGVVAGDLVLYGRGDPTMGRRCYAVDTTAPGACDADPFERLRDLAGQLRARGITTVQGDLIGDGSWFDGELVNIDWEIYDLNWWYAAPVSGLGFNDNSIDFTYAPGTAIGAPANDHLHSRFRHGGVREQDAHRRRRQADHHRLLPRARHPACLGRGRCGTRLPRSERIFRAP